MTEARLGVYHGQLRFIFATPGVRVDGFRRWYRWKFGGVAVRHLVAGCGLRGTGVLLGGCAEQILRVSLVDELGPFNLLEAHLVNFRFDIVDVLLWDIFTHQSKPDRILKVIYQISRLSVVRSELLAHQLAHVVFQTWLILALLCLHIKVRPVNVFVSFGLVLAKRHSLRSVCNIPGWENLCLCAHPPPCTLCFGPITRICLWASVPVGGFRFPPLPLSFQCFKNLCQKKKIFFF